MYTNHSLSEHDFILLSVMANLADVRIPLTAHSASSQGVLPLGSDFPVEGVNPLLGFYAAVSRLSANGNSPHGAGGWSVTISAFSVCAFFSQMSKLNHGVPAGSQISA